MIWECTVCRKREMSVDPPGCPCQAGHVNAWRKLYDSPTEGVIDRLPYDSHPGFDCRKDNANCPGCQIKKSDHGVFGGSAFFGVRTLQDGRAFAVVLEVLLRNYPPTVARSSWDPRLDRVTGAFLTFHVEKEGGEKCFYLGRPCESDAGCLMASELWDRHGDNIGGPEQSGAFWRALDEHLLALVVRETGGN